MRSRPLVAAFTLTAALALSACTGGSRPPLPGGGPAQPTVAIQEGPAPSVTAQGMALRADQVTR